MSISRIDVIKVTINMEDLEIAKTGLGERHLTLCA
jgi:hypothetical protein